ncbi:hypothetical protein O6H91_17G078700 [Diphasiastrum complanatum]|nr:hypothetical protein O6H91_17G078700 [Diphasiastrum complanatum]
MEEWTRCVKGLSPRCSLSHDRSQLMAIGTATGRLQQIRDIEPTIPSSSPSVSKTRLHFTPGMLLKIKQKSTNTLTTFAAITGHLWRCISKARRLDPEVVTCVAISIDGRGRLNPPLPESYFGNAVFVPLTISIAQDLLNNPASCPASLIQTSLAQANDQYLRESLLHIQKTVESLDQNSTMPTAAHPNLVVTSWLKFPLYEMDFGWGGPAFVGNVPRGEEGLLLLLPSYTRDGSIDAVVQLFSADLQNLEELCYNI